MRHILLAICISLCSAPLGAEEIAPLQLLRALPVDGPAQLQPSGLTSCRGALLMVGDKHDHAIFELRLDANRATATRFIALPELNVPDVGVPGPRRLSQRLTSWVTGALFDWEGIACGPDDTIWMASEAYAAVLRVPAADSPQWLAARVYPAAREAKLFSRLNAVVEGIAVMNDRIILAAERDPRGLITLVPRNGSWRVERAVAMDDRAPAPPRGRKVDFADLYAADGKLYTLERNAHAVCRRNADSFAVERCWSYAHVENDPAHLYRDVRHGLAEGLTVHDGKLYVVLDNNNDARRDDTRDRRAQLFEFQLPADWPGEVRH